MIINRLDKLKLASECHTISILRDHRSLLRVFTYFFWTCPTIYTQLYHSSTSNRSSAIKFPYRAVPLMVPSKFPIPFLHISFHTRYQNFFLSAFSWILLNPSLIFNVTTQYLFVHVWLQDYKNCFPSSENNPKFLPNVCP